MKIAFIGDSFSAYDQEGQEKNHWSYLLAQQFPQHQYFNYSTGGRGYDYFRLAIVDAKIKDVDVVVTNRTFNHRTFQHYGDKDGMFEVLTEVDDNYTTFAHNYHYWYSVHSDTVMRNTKPPAPAHIEKSIQEALSAQSMSTAYQNFNNNWYDNMDSLYNFKHIIKLELLDDPNDEYLGLDNAYIQLSKAFNVDQQVQRDKFERGVSVASDELRKNLLIENDLIISYEDDHWSPKANKWVFDNYILTKFVDILS